MKLIKHPISGSVTRIRATPIIHVSSQKKLIHSFKDTTNSFKDTNSQNFEEVSVIKLFFP